MSRIYNQDNWYQWGYHKEGWASDPYALRQYKDEKLYVHYGRLPGKFKTFKEAVLDNARSTCDYYQGRTIHLLASGGMDSELVLRAYKAIGANVVCHVFQYENNWNIYDVAHSVLMADETDTPLHIHNFNLTDFFESGSFAGFAEHAQSDRPRALVQLAFLQLLYQQVDGVIVSASSDPRWYRPHDDYTEKAVWRCQDFEHDIALDRYAHLLRADAIMQWFKWTPELTLAWFSLKWFADLVSDRIPGKLGVVSTKIRGYQEVFPEMRFRVKKTGFESIDHLVEPAQAYLEQKNSGLHYRQMVDQSADDLWMKMTGHGYYTR